ncbi:MAG: deoxyribodipyrimidine photo-lyase, partial [Lutibacter sp.]|nr:deoxyribodipyrimidine photo-lyase [Lutibacter sp.]MBP9602354.1 deoxyribodipyrimidine photo-lyase [Lutibacter sp.]
MKKEEIAVFWFRRDLRLHDNYGLYNALQSGYKVLPIFIFDEAILSELPKNDARVSFIYETLNSINNELLKVGASIKIEKGTVFEVWKALLENFNIKEVYTNKDYEPYAIQREATLQSFFSEEGVSFKTFKDQVIFEEAEIVKEDGLPYTVYTPYKNKWLKQFSESTLDKFPSENYLENLLKENFDFPSLNEIGFQQSEIKVLPYNNRCITDYE